MPAVSDMRVRGRRRGGVVLLVVLFFTLLLSASIVSFLRRSTVDAMVARNRDQAADKSCGAVPARRVADRPPEQPPSEPAENESERQNEQRQDERLDGRIAQVQILHVSAGCGASDANGNGTCLAARSSKARHIRPRM